MVIDNHKHKPHLDRRFNFRGIRNTAIDRDDETNTALSQTAQPLNIQAVSLFDPMRHVENRLGADLAEKRNQDGRPGGAIDIVIAPNRDLLLVFDRLNHALDRRFHISHFKGRWQVGTQARR